MQRQPFVPGVRNTPSHPEARCADHFGYVELGLIGPVEERLECQVG